MKTFRKFRKTGIEFFQRYFSNTRRFQRAQLEGVALSKPLISPWKRGGGIKMHVSKGMCVCVSVQSKRWRMIRGDRIADGWGRKKEQPKINSAVPGTSCPRVSRLRDTGESRDRCKKKKNRTSRVDSLFFLDYGNYFWDNALASSNNAGVPTFQVYIAENFPSRTFIFHIFVFHLLKNLENCKFCESIGKVNNYNYSKKIWHNNTWHTYKNCIKSI